MEEVTIERILPGGLGLTHVEGQTVLVSLAAPDDVLRVQIDRVRGKVAFASILEIIKPSAQRIQPPCPYFGRCGGCDFQQLNYESQLNAKVDMIRDCLRRIAQIEEPLEIPITPAPNQWQYRVRANWQLDPGTGEIGYFEAGSHRVCDVEFCAVLEPELQKALERIRAAINNGTIVDLPRDIRAATGSGEVSVAPPVAGLQTAEVHRSFGEEDYWFTADSFFQVNSDLLESLLDKAIGGETGMLALDLYSGAGLFTLPLARRFKRVVAVEVNDRATEFARHNLKRAGLANTQIVNESVGSWLRKSSVEFGKVDFLLLDPPRAGAENIVIKGILELHPPRICYVSCDPATLARDLKKLITGGYRLQSLIAFDLFPQTHHVEVVVHLVSTGGKVPPFGL